MRSLGTRVVLAAAAVALGAVLAAPTAARADQTVTCTPTANGRVCRIDQPVVNQPSAAVPLWFDPGDVVLVEAGGCVQTGGHGRTWKDYVNPSGSNSGPRNGGLYHGLIDLPGAPGGLVPLIDVNHQTRQIPPGLRNHDALQLRIGYADDNYGDNGYSGHDDGDNDQCKGVGPAFIKLTITHAGAVASPPPNPVLAPLDLVPDAQGEFDDNGLPQNPIWGAQAGKPALSSVDVRALCPNLSFNAGCTTQQVSSDLEPAKVDWLNGLFDAAGFLVGGGVGAYLVSQDDLPFDTQLCPEFGGHENWFPATFTGSLTFTELSESDDDINFELAPAGSRFPATGTSPSLGVEIDAEEIPGGLPLWGAWSQALQDGNANGPAAAAFEPPSHSDAVVTGLVGLDCVHDCIAELHPALAIAYRADATHWRFLIRNFGDEGFCSSNMHWLGDAAGTAFTLRLPHEFRTVRGVVAQASASDANTATAGNDMRGAFVTVNAPELNQQRPVTVAGSIEVGP